MQLTIRNAYREALKQHRDSDAGQQLQQLGWKLSDWTSGTAWELGSPDNVNGCYLIASERDGVYGDLPLEDDIADLGMDDMA